MNTRTFETKPCQDHMKLRRRGFKPAPHLLVVSRLASSFSLKTNPSGIMSQVLPPVVKSPLDTREYRALLLSNKLKVLCCSDSTTDKSAASLSVAAGSMNDPENVPGLAHFCEHMLFLGTKKYPVENDYSKFLAENGGSSNAYTARDHTNYYFDVAPEALESTLDRFAQFFISPLFTESATEREINAVHSEHEKNIPVDAWRSHQLELSTANKNHPYSRFATGNRKTLWDDTRKNGIDVCSSLKEYHRQYYSSNIMSLAVLGKETLDDLQVMVEKMFCEVKNFDIPLPRWEESPYTSEQLQKRLSVVPIKDVRYLTMLFPVPDYTKSYKSSADGYVSHLLGHEGEGSLLSLLKARNWVNALETANSIPARGFGTYKLAVDLTPEGLKHVDDIVDHVFQYLKMLTTKGPQKWIWEEMRDVNAVIFRFKDKQRPQSFVSNLTSIMQDYPLEDALSAGYILSDYNEQLINNVLSHLVPSNCRITVTSKDMEPQCSLSEAWYGVKYNLESIDSKALQRWENCEPHPDLKLPSPNAFIPTVFDLKTRDENTSITPRILLNTPFSRVWFLQDNEFKLPKAVVRLESHSALPLVDPLNSNLNYMMVEAVKDALTEYSYSASVAGLYYQITETIYGHEVLDRFDVIKEQQIRTLRNWKDNQPYSHATYHMTTLLREKRWTNEELLEAMKDVTLEKVISYAQEFVSKLKLEWLLFGNLTAQESLELVNKCQSFYEAIGSQPILASQAVLLREVELPTGSNYIFKSEHHSHLSSCVAVLFQAGLQDTKNNVIVELLEHIAHEPCFNQLRTQEQLGYIVFTGVRRASGTQGIQYIVQSDRHPAYVESRIHNFINSFHDLLHALTEEEFLQHRFALRIRKAEKPKKLKDRASTLWSEIVSQQYNFERQDIEIAALDQLTLQEIIQYFDETFGPSAPQRRRLAVHVTSMIEGGAGVNINEVDAQKGDGDYPEDQIAIEDPTEWKTHLPLFPTAKPFLRIPSFLAPSKSKL
ncbi:unnamed protein product [Allacma fusca]|uniref:Insulin-degrading enzyme n=1 Tax=Allacma fusca TaxID=39272 RepID=A0A8J2KN03_9HEXA|nr:unnamed protein product [Allacma fusca]